MADAVLNAVTGLPELTAAETDLLTSAEAVIERGLQTFVEVGDALMQVRENKLYRATHATFEAYCRVRWGFTDSRARQLIGAAQTVTNVTEAGLPAPTNEGQARALTGVPQDQRAEVWAETLDRTEGKPTAAAIAETAAARPLWVCAGCGAVTQRTKPPANCPTCQCPAHRDLVQDLVPLPAVSHPDKQLVFIAARREGYEHHRVLPTGASTTCGWETVGGNVLPVGVLVEKYGSIPCATCWPPSAPAEADDDDAAPVVNTGWHCCSCGCADVARPAPCQRCGAKTNFHYHGREIPDVDAEGTCRMCAPHGHLGELVYTAWLRDAQPYCRLTAAGKKTICGANTSNGHIVTRRTMHDKYAGQPCTYGCWPDATAAADVATANAVPAAGLDNGPQPDGEDEGSTSLPTNCEKCGMPLDEIASLGYLRCEECDSEGEHISIDGGPCQVCAPDEHAAEKVWMAADRLGLAYHGLTPEQSRTRCDRSINSGRVMTRGEAAGQIGGKPCRTCWPNGDAAPAAPEETPVPAPAAAEVAAAAPGKDANDAAAVTLVEDITAALAELIELTRHLSSYELAEILRQVPAVVLPDHSEVLAGIEILARLDDEVNRR